MGIIIDFVCILDLESWKSSQRTQSGYLGRMKGLSIMIYMMIYMMILMIMIMMIIMMIIINIITLFSLPHVLIFTYCVSYMQLVLTNCQSYI